MSGTADALGEGRAAGRRVQAMLRIAAGLAGVALVAAPPAGRMASAIEVRTFVTGSPSRVPIVQVTRGAPDASRPVVFLVHGFQCNKSMMVPLARRLAGTGVDAYAIDLPGHGASREPFSDARAVDAAREGLDFILANRAVAPERVALVGHSYGASVLARIAGQDPRRPSLVMIGPGYEGGLSRATGNLLIVTAKHDYPFIAAFARGMLHDASAGALDAPGESTGRLARGNARAWREVEGDHLSLLLSTDVARDTIAWLQPSLERPPDAAVAPSRLTVALALLAIAGAVLVSVLVAHAGARAWAADTRAAITGSRASLIAVGVVAIAIGLVAARRAMPFAFLRLYEGQQIASLLVVAGLVANAVALVAWRRTPLPDLRQTILAVPPALGAATLVYLAALAGIDGELYRVSLADAAPGRLATAIVLTISFFPFFAFVHGLVGEARATADGVARFHVRASIPVAVLYGIVAAALPLVGPRLGRFTFSLLAIVAFCAATGTLLDRAARNPAVGAIFSATITAWVISVGFLRY